MRFLFEWDLVKPGEFLEVGLLSAWISRHEVP